MTTILSYVPYWRYDPVPAFWRLLAQLGLGAGRGVAAVVADAAGGMVSGRLVGYAGAVCRQLAAGRGYNAVDGVSFTAARGLAHPGWRTFADWRFGLAGVSFLDVGLSAWAVSVAGPLVYQAALRLSPLLFALLIRRELGRDMPYREGGLFKFFRKSPQIAQSAYHTARTVETIEKLFQ